MAAKKNKKKAVPSDAIALKPYHSTQASSSAIPGEQQEQSQQLLQVPPGNPNELWIRRQKHDSAYMISVSDLMEKGCSIVSGLRKHLTEEFTDWKDIPPDDIFIYKHGEKKSLAQKTRITELAGNTEETPHFVEVKVGWAKRVARAVPHIIIFSVVVGIFVSLEYAIDNLIKKENATASILFVLFIGLLGVYFGCIKKK